MQMALEPPRINDDILPIGEAKANLSRILRELGDRGRPVVITQNGRPAGVVITPAEYDRLTEKDRITTVVEAGLADVRAGRVHTTDELRAALAARRKARAEE